MTGIRLFLLAGLLIAGCRGPQTQSDPVETSTVIEVVTFKLRPGVEAAGFRTLDRAVEFQHVARQPGFISRESAAGEDGEWLVIVHWRSVEDAEASMASFSSAPATEQFMANIDVSSMVMKRYSRE